MLRSFALTYKLHVFIGHLKVLFTIILSFLSIFIEILEIMLVKINLSPHTNARYSVFFIQNQDVTSM